MASLSRLTQAALLLLMVSHCSGQTEDALQPLPDELAREHEAPLADGSCPELRDEPESWTTSQTTGDIEPRNNLRMVLDPCGNVLLAWEADLKGEAWGSFVVLTRFFRDGKRDWATSF